MMKMDMKSLIFFLCASMIDQFSKHGNYVSADVCGTRFTDFTSSAVLAQIVLEGAIKDYNPPPQHSQVRSAKVTVQKVYKGMEVLKEFNRSVEEGDEVLVHHFGVEDMDDCIAPMNDDDRGQDKIFFLRQTSHRGMLRLSAMPVNAPSNMDRRFRRSLCDTCLKPPEIKRLVCQDCAKEPTIKTMKSKTAKIGKRARLKCSARGKPTPNITWAKGTVPIVSGVGGITIRTSGLSSVLIFSPITNAHSGRYKCIATNEIGQVEEVVTLNVTRSRRSRPTYSIETAPDKVLCQHNPCLNGGSCIFSPSLNLRRCLCSSGFEGVQCENDESGSEIGTNQNFKQDSTVAASDPPNVAPGNDAAEPPVKQVTQFVAETTSKQSVATTHKLVQSTTHEVITSTDVHTTTTSTTSTTSPSRDTTSSTTVPAQESRSRSSVISRGQLDPRFPLLRKSSLKIIPCKEKYYCQNRGKCRYIRKLDKKFCKCRSGYAGPRCERKL